MTSKCLLRLLRSGVSFFISSGTCEACPPAASKLASTGESGLLIDSAGPVRASRFSCLPLSGSCHHHSSSPSSIARCPSEDIEDDLSTASDNVVDELKQLARSHSCSKLQGRKQLKGSVKFLLHQRASSHRYVDHGYLAESYAKLHGLETDSPKCPPRSWSLSSLQREQHNNKQLRKARSSHTSPDHGGSGRRCAPRGHVAIYVEGGQRRQVVPIAYLSHPLFQGLLERAEREYGYCQGGPGLRIPCLLSELNDTLHHIRTQS